MTYLGLAPKETGFPVQDALQNGPGDEDKKVSAIWEQMNKGISNKTHKSFPNKCSSTMDKSSQKKSDVRTFLFLSVSKETNQTMFVLN